MVLLLRSTGVVDSLAVAGPALLILVGLLVIFGRGVNQRVVATADRVNSFNVFSGSEIASHSDHFEGGSVGALFGGAEIDLRDAQPAPGAELDVFVAFGGAEIKVPQGWQVITHGMPIFGGFENVTAKETYPGRRPGPRHQRHRHFRRVGSQALRLLSRCNGLRRSQRLVATWTGARSGYHSPGPAWKR